MVEDILKNIEGPAWMLLLVIYIPKIVDAIRDIVPALDRIGSSVIRMESKFSTLEHRLENLEISVRYQERIQDDLSRSN